MTENSKNVNNEVNKETKSFSNIRQRVACIKFKEVYIDFLSFFSCIWKFYKFFVNLFEQEEMKLSVWQQDANPRMAT